MLTKQEVTDFTAFVNGIDPNSGKELGQKLIIDYINNLFDVKIEEQCNKLIRYYEGRLEEEV